MKRTIPLLLILALLLCGCGAETPQQTSAPTEQTAPSVPATTEPTEQTDPAPAGEEELLPAVLWKNNLLRQDFMEVLGASRSHIRTATFLSSRRDAPGDAVELSAGTGSVLGWIQDGEHLFIAADSGINGAESAPGLFAGCVSLETVTFGTAYRTDLTTSLERMFYGCVSLRSVDSGRLNTAAVTNMVEVFRGCMSLRAPQTQLWDTGAVTDMTGLFSGCMSLEAAEVDSWNVEKVKTMDSLFEGCTALGQLDLSRWDLSEVDSMEDMFRDCGSLMDIGSFPMDHPAVDESTFAGCTLPDRQ